MNPKITPDHLGRAAVVYVRQSTMAQVTGNLESQRRQYDLAKAAEAAGFASVTVIDDDLGRSGSGTMQRPGFERLVAMVCSGDVGAVYCIEASRLARNGRDWHHLIDLCALAGTLVVDPNGAYPGGHEFRGFADLREWLLSRPDQFAHTVTEKLMAYALGRRIEYYDQPTIRQIVRDAAPEYRWSSIVLGIVESPAFLMTTAAMAAQ